MPLANNQYTAFDLFAGAGGLSLGLEAAGFEVLFANEIEPAYAETLRKAHPKANVCVDDIRLVNPATIRKSLSLRKGELTLLAGGPPCQGFSINAPIRTSGDARNHLFLNFLKFVEELRPLTVLIENVPGMISFEKGGTVKAILSSLRALGYQADVRVLYAPHFGVPQMRWRTVFLGSRGVAPALSLYPIPKHRALGRANFTTSLDRTDLVYSSEYVDMNATKAAVTVGEAILDLPPIANGGGAVEMPYGDKATSAYQRALRMGSKTLFNHQCAGLGVANLARLPHIPQGGSWRDIPYELLPRGMKQARRSDHTKRYGRLHPDRVASTILTKCDPHWGSYIHPNQDRIISVREAARIQSFPDVVRFFGSLSEQYEQVGNAVPPAFGAAIANRIKEVIEHTQAGSKVFDGLPGKQVQGLLRFQ